MIPSDSLKTYYKSRNGVCDFLVADFEIEADFLKTRKPLHRGRQIAEPLFTVDCYAGDIWERLLRKHRLEFGVEADAQEGVLSALGQHAPYGSVRGADNRAWTQFQIVDPLVRTLGSDEVRGACFNVVHFFFLRKRKKKRSKGLNERSLRKKKQ